MNTPMLMRQSHRSERPGLPLLGRFRLAGARAHEICGAARRRLALWLAAEAQGPVIWIRPAWHPDRLHMAGLGDEIDPGRLLMVDAARPEDLLWVMEEVLRAGAVALVVCDLTDPPGLTPVRRLHLAAEAGGKGGIAPLGLILTPGMGGAPGVESRWRLEPAHEGGAEGWVLSRLRARDAGPGDWAVARVARGRAQLVERAVEGV
ncbi:ImuA family protein [Roseicyclus sp.]|uniref:ImuA family protein n=1 Tax=Roseicyclus sp. TaxID=1914329 RepID=UPI003F6D322B